MPDPAIQPEEATPAAPLPVPTEAEIEARIQREVQARFSGYQSAQDKRLAAAEKKIASLSRATLSEREAEELEQSDLAAENARIKAENDLLRAGQKYGPEVTAAFTSLLSAERPEDQLEIVSRWINPPSGGTPPITPQPTPVAPPAPVDPNRPPRLPDTGDTREMDQATADRLLAPYMNQRWSDIV